MAEREDWTSFRTIEGLQQKAGVSAKSLRRLVAKEIADNALDTGANVRFGWLGETADAFYIQDDGPGIDGTPQQIAELFSIRRPMRSSKLLRRPLRGALGNGLRVVAGAVLASEGSLAVTTRNQRIVLRPRSDGHTDVVKLTKVNHPRGTRIEVGLGEALPEDSDALVWARQADKVAQVGKSYKGRSSPYWYDAAAFHELLLAHGELPLRSLVAELDGCTGARAGDIVRAAGLERKNCNDVDRAQAINLLNIARREAKPVRPQRLGAIGPHGYPRHFYAIERDTVTLGSVRPLAQIPFVVESWARKLDTDENDEDDFTVRMTINRTPATDEMMAWRDSDKDLVLTGCGLDTFGRNAPKKGKYEIVINVTAPYCPITSDGKAPDLSACEDKIIPSVIAALRKAQRAEPKEQNVTQKASVLAHLLPAAARAGGGYRFGERQVYYQLRDIVQQETGRELNIGHFKAIVTDYEAEHGDIPDMYRESRGSIYHPHSGDEIPLGTLTVEKYERPQWLFSNLVSIEKEGWSEALKDERWPEQHDCMLMSSKGYSTRAARDLIDKLAEHDEPITVGLVHDADAPGTMIYETTVRATKARGARKIRVINLGLEPWEAEEMGLAVERVPRSKRRKPVAQYVHDYDREHGTDWAEWLQTHRVELNAMTTPQLIRWLDRKMAEHGFGKLVPPDKVLDSEVEQRLAAKVGDAVRERILREAGYDKQKADALAAIKRPTAKQLNADIRKLFARKRDAQWRDHIEQVTAELTEHLAPQQRKRRAKR